MHHTFDKVKTTRGRGVCRTSTLWKNWSDTTIMTPAPTSTDIRQNGRNPNRPANRLENENFKSKLHKYTKQEMADDHATGDYNVESAGTTVVPGTELSQERAAATAEPTTVQSRQPSWSPSSEPSTLEPSVSPSLAPTPFPTAPPQTVAPTVKSTRTKRSASTPVPTTLSPTPIHQCHPRLSHHLGLVQHQYPPLCRRLLIQQCHLLPSRLVILKSQQFKYQPLLLTWTSLSLLPIVIKMRMKTSVQILMMGLAVNAERRKTSKKNRFLHG